MDASREEQWRPIKGLEGSYEVSDRGRVRSLARVIECKGHWQRGPYLKRLPGKILAPAGGGKGSPYLSVYLPRPYRSSERLHVLVLEAFVGPRPPGMYVRHLNGNHKDNRLENLAWGTAQENSLDTVRHGNNKCAQKTHCPQGHEYTPENTLARITINGHNERLCRTCRRIRGRRPPGTPRKRVPQCADCGRFCKSGIERSVCERCATNRKTA